MSLLDEIRRPHTLRHVSEEEKGKQSSSARTPTSTDGGGVMSVLKEKIGQIRFAISDDDESDSEEGNDLDFSV